MMIMGFDVRFECWIPGNDDNLLHMTKVREDLYHVKFSRDDEYSTFVNIFFTNNTNERYSVQKVWQKCDAKLVVESIYFNFVELESFVRKGLVTRKYYWQKVKRAWLRVYPVKPKRKKKFFLSARTNRTLCFAVNGRMISFKFVN